MNNSSVTTNGSLVLGGFPRITRITPYDSSLMAISNDSSLVVALLVIGTAALFLNSLQLWCLNNKLRDDINPLLVTVHHLSLADLAQALVYIGMAVGLLVAKEVPMLGINGLQIVRTLVEIVKVLQYIVDKYLFAVTTVTLAVLSLLSMMMVTRNGTTQFERKKVTNVCRAIWSALFILFTTEYTAYKAGLYPLDPKVLSLRLLTTPLLTFPLMMLIACCFARICWVKRETQVRRSRGEVARMLIFQLAYVGAYVVFAVPVSIFTVIQVTVDLRAKQVAMIQKYLMIWHALEPAVDPVFFFVVYRKKLMRQRRVGFPVGPVGSS